MTELQDKEQSRLRALQRFEILDTPPDGSFDHITALAAKIFNMPIALITLVDHDRIWFKSGFGLEGVTEIGRDPGLCASAILSDEIYLVENALEDPRTLANPLVCGEFGLRFYAAAPLTTHDGYNLGTLCLIDKSQRFLNQNQQAILQDLARIVVDEMQLRLSARQVVSKSQQRIAELEREISRLEAEK